MNIDTFTAIAALNGLTYQETLDVVADAERELEAEATDSDRTVAISETVAPDLTNPIASL
jgi:hypothetical protein